MARSNPAFFGEDVETALMQAAGLGFVAYLNDTFAGPFVRKIGGPANATNAVGKLVDAGVTLGVAALAGEVIGKINGQLGRAVRHGGAILAGGKAISAGIKNFAVSAQFPAVPGLSSLAAAAAPPKADDAKPAALQAPHYSQNVPGTPLASQLAVGL